EIRLSNKVGKFFHNPNNSGSFDIAPSTPSVFTMGSLPAFFFNPPPSSNNNNPSDPLRVSRQTCIQSTGVYENTRPYTDVNPNTDGSCTLTIAQGNGQQAGLGHLYHFEAVFTASMIVPHAGNVIFH